MRLVDLLVGPCKSVHVALQSPFTSYRRAADARVLGRTGCNFETTDSARIEGLLTLLENVTVAAGKPWNLDPREAVFLRMESGTEFTLEFDRKWRDSDVGRGRLHQPGGDTINLVSPNDLPDDLFHWAAALGRPVAKDLIKQPQCDSWFSETHRHTPWSGPFRPRTRVRNDAST